MTTLLSNLRIEINPSIPEGEIHLRDDYGKVYVIHNVDMPCKSTTVTTDPWLKKSLEDAEEYAKRWLPPTHKAREYISDLVSICRELDRVIDLKTKRIAELQKVEKLQGKGEIFKLEQIERDLKAAEDYALKWTVTDQTTHHIEKLVSLVRMAVREAELQGAKAKEYKAQADQNKAESFYADGSPRYYTVGDKQNLDRIRGWRDKLRRALAKVRESGPVMHYLSSDLVAEIDRAIKDE